MAGIINAVSRTRGIEKIRILDKDGTIISSTLPADVGRRVDKTAEECYHCHVAGKPLQQIPGSERHRIYTSTLGHRILGTIDVIRNEPACSTAACHAHPASTTVLRVLDIAYSLEEMDHRLRGDVLAVIAFATALALAIFLVVVTVVQRFVSLPLRDLEDGARRVSAGDRTHLIPVRSHDEIGHLADSFNAMTVALRECHRRRRGTGRGCSRQGDFHRRRPNRGAGRNGTSRGSRPPASPAADKEQGQGCHRHQGQ